MMGERQVDQAALFYEFSIERHVPQDHLLRAIDHFVDLSEVRRDLAPFYSSLGRPSIDPELLIRMLLVGYCCGIRTYGRHNGRRLSRRSADSAQAPRCGEPHPGGNRTSRVSDDGS
jgi:hypothetical protein